jgi:hypothetical protein
MRLVHQHLVPAGNRRGEADTRKTERAGDRGGRDDGGLGERQHAVEANLGVPARRRVDDVADPG